MSKPAFPAASALLPKLDRALMLLTADATVRVARVLRGDSVVIAQAGPVSGEADRTQRLALGELDWWLEAEVRDPGPPALVWNSTCSWLADVVHGHEAAEAWRGLVGALPEGVALFDGEGRVVELNRAAEVTLGLTRQEVLAEGPQLPKLQAALNADLQPMGEFPRRTVRRTGKAENSTVIGLPAPDGTVRWLLTTAVPLGDGLVLCSMRDYTSIRNEAEELDRRTDQFIRTLSHELRTPLTSLDGALSLAQHGVGGPMAPETRDLIDIARRSTSRLVRLVNDVLDLERIRAGSISLRIARHEVGHMAAAAVRAASPFAGQRGVQITCLSDTPLLLLTDSDRIEQILSNFLVNAVGHCRRGGRIDVSVERVGERARITVTDNGTGVPSSFVPKLFTRFAQADPSRQGAGLGLSICRALATSLGGEVGFDQPGPGGAAFWLELPLGEE